MHLKVNKNASYYSSGMIGYVVPLVPSIKFQALKQEIKDKIGNFKKIT
jgi:hypothetical protein